MIWFKNICYADWKSLHIPIASTKISGLNVFLSLVEGVRPYNVCQIISFCTRATILLPANVCISIPPHTLFVQTWYFISAFSDRARIKGIIIVILCTLYCNVSHRWMRPEVIRQHWRRLSSCRRLACGHVIRRRRGFGQWFAGRVGSYAFKASLLLLTSPKSPTLPLTAAYISTYVKSKL